MKPNDPVPSISELPIVVVAKGYETRARNLPKKISLRMFSREVPWTFNMVEIPQKTQSNLILPKQFWQKRARLNSNTEKNRNRHVVDQIQHSQKPTYFLPVHTWQVR